MSGATNLVDKIIKVLIYDVAVNAAVEAAVVEVPILGLPVVKQVFSFLVGRFADLVYAQLEPAVVFSIIEFQTDKERQAYQNSIMQLQTALNGGSLETINQAKESFKSNLRDLIRVRPA